MKIDHINQIFIRCHDNDFWSYYTHALKSVFEWYNSSFRDWQNTTEENVTSFIEKNLDNLYELCHGGTKDKFPWKIKVYFNEEAKQALEKYRVEYRGNSECAYMDIETYLITPGATIDQFIFNV